MIDWDRLAESVLDSLITPSPTAHVIDAPVAANSGPLSNSVRLEAKSAAAAQIVYLAHASVAEEALGCKV